jgi:hypothetical protein
VRVRVRVRAIAPYQRLSRYFLEVAMRLTPVACLLRRYESDHLPRNFGSWTSSRSTVHAQDLSRNVMLCKLFAPSQPFFDHAYSEVTAGR